MTENRSPKPIVYKIELNRSPTTIQNRKSPYRCVYWKKGSCKWTSEFCDPATHKRYYLGSFETAEAAHQAYCKKKQEFEKKAASQNQVSGSGCGLVDNDCSSDEYFEPKIKLRIGKRAQPIRNPVRKTRSRVSACDSYSGIAVEPKKKPDKIGPVRKTLDQRGIEEKEAYENEKHEVEFSGMASVILDEDGYLLGEFSRIDDLTICEGGE